jgi:hypothetical protein
LRATGDRGDVGAAPRPDALSEAAHRPRSAGGDLGRLAEHVAGLSSALLGDPAVARDLGAGLTHAWIQPEVADQLTRRRKASDLAVGHERRGDDEVDAGNGEQPTDLGRAEGMLGQDALDDRHLAVQEGDLAQAALDGDLLIQRELLGGEPLAAALAEQVAGRRTRAQRARDHGVDLVLRAGALTDQLRAPRDPTPQRPRRLIGQPHLIQEARRQQPRQGPRVQRVGRSWPC